MWIAARSTNRPDLELPPPLLPHICLKHDLYILRANRRTEGLERNLANVLYDSVDKAIYQALNGFEENTNFIWVFMRANGIII